MLVGEGSLKAVTDSLSRPSDWMGIVGEFYGCGSFGGIPISVEKERTVPVSCTPSRSLWTELEVNIRKPYLVLIHLLNASTLA